MASGRRPSTIFAHFQPRMDSLLLSKLKPKTRPPPSLASEAPTGDLPGTDHLAFPMASIDEKKDAYSVWGLPPPDVSERIKKLMEGIRSEFGGPRFEPHVTVVGDIRLTESEARDKFRQACEGLQAYGAAVSKVATGPSFYQCVFLLLHPTPEVQCKPYVLLLNID
ncbi:unnamed protein product [Cuscuta campestris]|uniref:2',3'-cyclic-nucleotide 3'-phosphodiesterase n=1 Tax=Cuscuta campestris TaxID=132261 RepID=A0A484JZS4_9ASTE|nr:unnamed protein product [Cuscuta campestris]